MPLTAVDEVIAGGRTRLVAYVNGRKLNNCLARKIGAQCLMCGQSIAALAAALHTLSPQP